MFIIIKTKYYWQKNRLTDKWKKIEFPNTDQYSYSQFIFFNMNKKHNSVEKGVYTILYYQNNGTSIHKN